MDFWSIAATLKASGYPPRKADAKIAHDIVLKAIEDAGFHDKVTIKGGVVMSGITDAVRRATIDMDFDFLGYPLGDVSIRRFVQRLNRVARCAIRIDGEIQELRQNEYRGKRVNLVLTDDAGRSIRTKVDIGVHGNKSIEQVDFRFKVISDERFKNFRDYIATFPQHNGHFRFLALEGKPHGGVCYDNDAFLDLVFGKRE